MYIYIYQCLSHVFFSKWNTISKYAFKNLKLLAYPFPITPPLQTQITQKTPIHVGSKHSSPNLLWSLLQVLSLPYSFFICNICIYIWMEVFCWEIDSFVRDSMIGPPNMTNLTLNDLHEMTDVSNNAPWTMCTSHTLVQECGPFLLVTINHVRYYSINFDIFHLGCWLI